MSSQSLLVPFTLVGLVALVAGGCAMEDLEDPSLSSTESAVLLNTSTTRESMCEGYTNGGGQRVRGRARLTTVSISGGMFRHTVEVEASNWIKNAFGWNTKRTHQLVIQGNVDLYTPSGGNSFSVYADTGGNLETRIGGEVATITSINSYAEADVRLTFYGRDLTVCTM